MARQVDGIDAKIDVKDEGADAKDAKIDAMGAMDAKIDDMDANDERLRQWMRRITED